MLIDRKDELAELNDHLADRKAVLLSVSGRRRLGKTALLSYWAENSGVPFLYWTASQIAAQRLLEQFSQQIFRLLYPDRSPPEKFTYPNWHEAFQELAIVCKDRRHIVVLDEFPYAINQVEGLTSILQNAWDHQLKKSNLVLYKSGALVEK